MHTLHAQLGDTVGLAVLDSRARQGLIIGAAQSARHRLSFTLIPGTRFPLHTGAPAKAILAFLPPRLQRVWLSHLTLVRFTPQTITTRRAFIDELAAVAAAGYALDRAEEVAGCHCVSAPVLDDQRFPRAAIWITGPSNRLTLARLREAAPAVCEAARRVAEGLSAPALQRLSRDRAALCQRVARHLQATLAEPVDWASLSSGLGVSYSTLRHVFAEQTGRPPAQYRLELRLSEAKRLLQETALTIADIAARTGFGDPNHFSALFSRKTGCPPTRFRAKAAASVSPAGRG
jgi:AraC-like DNA-binding protein